MVARKIPGIPLDRRHETIDSALAESYAAGITSVEELYEKIRKADADAVKKP